MAFELEETVYIVRSTMEGTEPCEKCGLSNIENKLSVVEAEISDILSHTSVTNEPEVRYRVRIDGEVDMEGTSWRSENKIFKTHAEAEIELEKIKETLGE